MQSNDVGAITRNVIWHIVSKYGENERICLLVRSFRYNTSVFLDRGNGRRARNIINQ